MDDEIVRLRDGRCLAYRSWGHADGPVVLAFHGSPGSRVWWPGEEHTHAARVHLVTVDRPGYGASDPLPGRPLTGLASDVVELTAALGAERFGVVGWSGGAPFAAAVAATIPDRLLGVCLVSSASLTYGLDQPDLDDDDLHLLDLIDRYGLTGATLRFADEEQAWAEGVLLDPASVLTAGASAPGDGWVLHDPTLVADMGASFREAVRQGAIGAATDWIAHCAPWGFSLRDIAVPVHMWHGAQDGSIPVEQVGRLAAMLPHGTLTVWPDGGHLGIMKHWPSVLAACVSPA